MSNEDREKLEKEFHKILSDLKFSIKKTYEYEKKQAERIKELEKENKKLKKDYNDLWIEYNDYINKKENK